MIVLGLDSRVVTALVVGGGLALFGALLVITAAGELRGRRKAKVPASMRPAPSDEELERSVLTRYLAWGFLATALMAIWMPLYWIREPTRMAEKEQLFLAESVEHGHRLYEDFCLRCHGADGVGTIQRVVRDGNEQDYAEPPLAYAYARYRAGGRSEEEVTQILRDAIERGRPNTPMPTWAVAFGGPLNTFQVDNLMDYLQSIQAPFPEPEETDGEALFRANCAVCHGPNGAGVNQQGVPTVGPNLQVALERLSVEDVHEVISTGRLNTNRPSMPAWAALGEEALDALVQFIQSIQRS